MCGIDRRRQTLHPIAYQVRTDGRKANDEAPEWWRAAIQAIGRKRHHLDAARHRLAKHQLIVYDLQIGDGMQTRRAGRSSNAPRQYRRAAWMCE